LLLARVARAIHRLASKLQVSRNTGTRWKRDEGNFWFVTFALKTLQCEVAKH